ncbi:hypothetical protein SARC_05719 [Sphaeroforma arctica JP610]|uniref:Uncharacterized protein n=1 Tax=Sphaeroforma arctica JP610 TaxID=667725 RepID=A0A0L0FYT2_9EUKA|nr:hypothetical protein SARC_05719 [Sphaeroforma arctica JP610]KNC81990.1 hypothetical protein SARC_05719 [Sphaeroforma arctica JP610]|eukprot:XP_014155892.1 hypothetical protein SARC_05719 [Sphaeroforma arctica JP610]
MTVHANDGQTHCWGLQGENPLIAKGPASSLVKSEYLGADGGRLKITEAEMQDMESKGLRIPPANAFIAPRNDKSGTGSIYNW